MTYPPNTPRNEIRSWEEKDMQCGNMKRILLLVRKITEYFCRGGKENERESIICDGYAGEMR